MMTGWMRLLVAAGIAGVAGLAPFMAPTTALATTLPRPPVDFIPTVAAVPGTSVTLRLGDYCIGRPAKSVTPRAPGPALFFDERTQTLAVQVGADDLGWVHVALDIDGDGVDILLKSEQKPEQVFTYRPAKDVKSVSLVGSFNGWNVQADLMTKQADGSYSIARVLEPGRYVYKFVADGEYLTDESNPSREPDGFQGFNSILEVGLSGADSPGRFVQTGVAEAAEGGRAIVRYRLAYEPGGTGEVLDPASVVVHAGNRRLGANEVAATSAGVELRIPVPERRAVPVRVAGRDTAGALTREAGFLARPKGDAFLWNDQVLYFVFTDRFHNGDPANDDKTSYPEVALPAAYHGGDWAGLRQKIEEGYFSNLGVTALWISPVQKNAAGAWRDSLPPHRWFTSYHGYWPSEPRETNPHFGTLEELRGVVEAAHTRGIRVLADFVANHVHSGHPYFQEHPEWFGTYDLPDGRKNLRLFDEFPLTTWFDDFLPKFDYAAHPAARRAMVDDALWWVEAAGFDGFRQDATKHIPHEFWRDLTRDLKTRDLARTASATTATVPFFQIGESIADRDTIMAYVDAGQLDGQFDFPLYWDIRGTLALEATNFGQLDRSLRASLNRYGPWALNSGFLGIHDISRFMAFADGAVDPSSGIDEKDIGWTTPPGEPRSENYAKIRNAFTFVLTLPMIPTIYYGDEIGMTGAGDPDNRRMMRFGDEVTANEESVRQHVAELNALRHRHTALRAGDYTVLDAGERLYAYLRSDFRERLVVAINRGSAAAVMPVRLPEWARDGVSEAETVLGSGRLRAGEDGQWTVELGPRTSGVFLLK